MKSASNPAAAANQRYVAIRRICRLTWSEIAPASKANRKNGNEALVDIRDRRNGEAPSTFISHVAAVSWAETQHPETRPVIHSPKKTLFFSTNQTGVVCCCSVFTSEAAPQSGEVK